MFIQPTNENEIIEVINDLKLKKGGIDKINDRTLTNIRTLIADPLAYLFNLCIERSIWPDILKTAEVIPIYKSGRNMIWVITGLYH